jgi:hypothetical protein
MGLIKSLYQRFHVYQTAFHISFSSRSALNIIRFECPRLNSSLLHLYLRLIPGENRDIYFPVNFSRTMGELKHFEGPLLAGSGPIECSNLCKLSGGLSPQSRRQSSSNNSDANDCTRPAAVINHFSTLAFDSDPIYYGVWHGCLDEIAGSRAQNHRDDSGSVESGKVRHGNRNQQIRLGSRP